MQKQINKHRQTNKATTKPWGGTKQRRHTTQHNLQQQKQQHWEIQLTFNIKEDTSK